MNTAPILCDRGGIGKLHRRTGGSKADIVNRVVKNVPMVANIVVTRHINATPDKIFALVTDLPRMGEWSPENNGGSWVGGATCAAVGAKFKGKNSIGNKHWKTMAKVTELSSPSSFAFEVSAASLAVAIWRYDIAGADGGSDVTETFIDKRGKIVTVLGGLVTSVKDRETHNRAGMEKTLAELATAAEA